MREIEDWKEVPMSKPSANTQSKHIVVVGAGQIGTPLVAQLAAQGHTVRWVSRTRGRPGSPRRVVIITTPFAAFEP